MSLPHHTSINNIKDDYPFTGKIISTVTERQSQSKICLLEKTADSKQTRRKRFELSTTSCQLSHIYIYKSRDGQKEWKAVGKPCRKGKHLFGKCITEVSSSTICIKYHCEVRMQEPHSHVFNMTNSIY